MAIPTERYVRLKILEKKLENLGIKKIGEKFTREHYDKMMELYFKNKLDDNGLEFIHFTKFSEDEDDQDGHKNFEIFEKLFNEIASLDAGHKENHNSSEKDDKFKYTA